MTKDSLLASNNPDLSVVIPCLNEEDTMETCLSKLVTVAEKEKFTLEVIVADNGSQDSSVKIADSFNVRVVHVSQKGYGAALMAGIEAASAPLLLMADADDSYNFLDTPKFFNKLRTGVDLVQGCRLPKGGGTIEKGAMPWSHRYIGNPFFTFLVRNWFGAPINDVYCGMRAFRKDFYNSLKMRCVGMEFATEMIIKSANIGASMKEVAITLHKDGRIQHPPHLRTIRDGWKTLCFFLLFAPSKLLLLPGLILIFLGIFVSFLGISETSINNITFGAHTSLGASLFILSGYQALLMHSLSLDISERLSIHRQKKGNDLFRLEDKQWTGISLISFIIGISLWAKVFFLWQSQKFGMLDYASTMKIVIPGTTLICMAFLTVIFMFFRSWLKVVNNEE